MLEASRTPLHGNVTESVYSQGGEKMSFPRDEWSVCDTGSRKAHGLQDVVGSCHAVRRAEQECQYGIGRFKGRGSAELSFRCLRCMKRAYAPLRYNQRLRYYD